MKKEVKFIVLIVILIILIIVCKSILSFESINYKISVNKEKVKIKEIYQDDNYYIELKNKGKVYPFRIYEKLKQRKIVKDLYLYKDKNVECILPIIDNRIYIDMMCYKDEILYNYHYIKGEYPSLDKYVENINLYNINQFTNQEEDSKIIGINKYKEYNNFNKNIVITTYKGLIINGKEINLFNKDIYNNKLSNFINGYYIIADYNQEYSFDTFYVINLETKKKSKLNLKNSISFDSYIQGIVQDKIYLYDINSEIQYEIDVISKKIRVVSDKNYIKYYTNKKWEKATKVKANKELYFDYETLDNNFTRYDVVKEVNNNYYLYKKNGISYKLYKVDKNNINVYKYLIDVPTTNVIFEDDYLYYVYKNKLYYYSDLTGLKIVLENSELEFNDTIKYYIY